MEGTSRSMARRHATLAIGLLVAGVFVLRLGPGGGALQSVVPWAFFLLLLYAAVACLWWAATALRHRKPDPWAYDPELDGPVAEAMEGRSYLRTEPPAPTRPGMTLLYGAVAVLFLLAGTWLVVLGGRIWSSGNGAEAPSLSALAFFVFAAAFMAAGPWLAWAGLRRAR